MCGHEEDGAGVPDSRDRHWEREVAATLEPYVEKIQGLFTVSQEEAGKLAVRLWMIGLRPIYTRLIRECSICKKEMVLPDGEDNALHIRFTGGYSMFVDDYDEPIEAWLCHECAHKMCDAIAWINEIVKPHGSHSHKQKYHDAHPDHPGWDYD